MSDTKRFDITADHLFSRRLLMSLMGGATLAPGLVLPNAAWAQAKEPVLVSPDKAHPPVSPPPVPQTGDLIGKRDRSARMTTKVLINGEGPYDFVIDTGANRSVIAAELAAELKLPPGQPTRVHGIARIQDTQTVNVKSLRAGAVEAPISDVPVLARADLDCDGFLGIDAFNDRQVTFDFALNIVHLDRSHYERGFTEHPHGFAAVTSDITVAARQRFGQLTIIDADAARQKITCFIDSGAEKTVGNLAMRRAVQAVTADRNFTPVDVIIHGATGQDVPGQVALVPAMRIGGVHFSTFPVAFADLHTFDLWGLSDQPALMMGMDLLRIFDQVSVDFGHRQVRFRLAANLNSNALA